MTTNDTILLEARDISRHYGLPDTEQYQEVLHSLSLRIGKGDGLAITGPSGSGKTTLLNLLGSLDQPDTGEILYRGSDISRMDRKARSSFRNRSIGFVFQQHHLLPQFNLMENALVPVLPGNHDRKARQRAEELLRKTGLWEHRHKYPHELSGGECQRTAVVRSLVNAPEIILADEPTGALDHEHSLRLFELLLKFNREEGLALVVVTHSREMALKLDRTYRLMNGKLELFRES